MRSSWLHALLLAAPAAAFQVPTPLGAPARAAAKGRPSVAMSDRESSELAQLRYLWGDYEDGKSEAREVLQLLDLWDEEQDGGATECLLGEGSAASAGCCMIGPEPLEELCVRLDKDYVAPVMAKLFEEVLREASGSPDSEMGTSAWRQAGVASSSIPCVTVDKMRAKMRAMAEGAAKVHPLQSIPDGP